MSIAAVILVLANLAAAQGAEVTVKGSLICNGACVPEPKEGDHGPALFAIDGPPEIRADVDRILAEIHPEKGLDADAAQKLMDAFSARLKFRLAPDSPALKDGKNTGKNHYCMPAAASAVTGTVVEKDGVKWITATRIEPAALKFPAPLLVADAPTAMPGKAPVVLKIGDALTLPCIALPPGKFLMGTPVFMWPYFVEEYPHVVTITKPLFMAEIPVTQELWEAVMGANPSTEKNPRLPVQNPKFADVALFCRRVSEKNGRKVRLPTDAEWEYAARVGTSNLPFAEKYREQNSSGAQGFKVPLPVRSKKPNAWGLYDMPSCWWEITGDKGMYNVRRSETDPAYPPGAETARSQRSGRGIVKDGWSMGTHEFITEKADYAGQKFRVVVEGE